MFDIEDLIEPVDDEHPAGRDLRLDPGDLTFQTLKDYTTVGEDPDDEANWSGVESLCVSALREKSKDLELATALTQAWAQTEGIAGARQGIELTRRLLDTFWATIHPGVDPDDGEIALPLRARWLNWLDAPNGFIKAIKHGPFITGPGDVTFTWKQKEDGALLADPELSAERRDELLELGVISEAEWGAALSGVDGSAMRTLVVGLEGAIESTRAMAAFCAERFEDEEPPDFFNLLNVLDEMHEHVAPYATEDEPQAEAAAAAGGATAPGGAPSGPISSRQDALRALQEVGDYFRRSEPHSPISYLIARAVKWGGMPLDQLMRDVVRNDDVIEHIWETLGLDASASGQDDEDEY